MNEKKNLAELRGLIYSNNTFKHIFSSLKKTITRVNKSNWYWIHLLPNILGTNKEKRISKACLKMILQSFCKSLSKILSI
jgi:hypothetical protein